MLSSQLALCNIWPLNCSRLGIAGHFHLLWQHLAGLRVDRQTDLLENTACVDQDMGLVLENFT